MCTQVKILRPLPGGNQFVSYLDAIGTLDGAPCVLDWKTTTSRYQEVPTGVWSLDPQLLSYSWPSGIANVALIAFVRKRLPEIQYLKAAISEQQRQQFWPFGRDHGEPNRGWAFRCARRHPVSPKRASNLSASRAVPSRQKVDRSASTAGRCMRLREW